MGRLEHKLLQLLNEYAGVTYQCGTVRELSCNGSVEDTTYCIDLDPSGGALVGIIDQHSPEGELHFDVGLSLSAPTGSESSGPSHGPASGRRLRRFTDRRSTAPTIREDSGRSTPRSTGRATGR